LEAFRLADRMALMREGRIIQMGRPADIVLNPANEYVAQFTEDVSLLRVITARDLMTPSSTAGAPTGNGAARVPADTPLETLVPKLASGTPAFDLTDESGSVIGTMAAAAAIDVLNRDQQRKAHP
jgi:glycine betaine/proline transport system ATP-binding protein